MTTSAVMLTQDALANPCSQNTGGDGTGAADGDNAIGQGTTIECNFKGEVITFDLPTPTPTPTTATLTVIKNVQCVGGQQCPGLPQPSVFTMFVFAPPTTPNPTSFVGSAGGTTVTIQPGNYDTGETQPTIPGLAGPYPHFPPDALAVHLEDQYRLEKRELVHGQTLIVLFLNRETKSK